MAAILNSAMLDSDTAIFDSDTLFSSLRFTQKQSHSTLNLTQTNLIWLKLSHLSFSSQTHSHLPRLVPNICTKNFTHSFWLNLMIAALLNSAILDSDILHKITFTCSFWLNLMMAAILNSAMLYSAILVFPLKLTHTCLDWSHHWHKKNFTHTSLPTICIKNFTHSFWLNLMMAAILNSFLLDSSMLVFPIKLTHTWLDWSHHWHKKHFTHSSLPTICTKNFTYSFWLNLMVAAILNSAIMDSDTLLSSLRFTQKHSHSFLTLTQTNSIWLKLIHYHLTWWWQPSWILPSWILPSWIQPS